METLNKEILKRLDYQLELDKEIFDELVAIRNTIKELNSRPLNIKLEKNKVLEEFYESIDEGEVYDYYAECYPESITSDTDYYDIPDDFITNEYTEKYFEEWLYKNYGVELDDLI